MSLHSDHINYLILRYLQEHGHESAARAFYTDWHRPYAHRDPETLPFASVVKRDALVSVVQDGLYFDELAAQARQAGRKYRFVGIDPRADMHLDVSREEDGEAEDEQPLVRMQDEGKRKGRVGQQSMRAPDEFPTPPPKRQRRGGEEGTVNGEAMEVDDTADAEGEDDAEVASPAMASEVDVVEVPERYDSMDIGIQTVRPLEPKTITTYLPIEKPTASTMQCSWRPNASPEESQTLLVTGDSICRLYEVSSTEQSQEASYLDEPQMHPHGTVTASSWHPRGHTAACAVDVPPDSNEEGARRHLQLVIGLDSERGTSIHDADATLLEPPGVLLCLRYCPNGRHLLMLRTNTNRGFIQVWRSRVSEEEPSEDEERPVAAYRVNGNALDACWISDDTFVVCGDTGLCNAFKVDAAAAPNGTVDDDSDHGLLMKGRLDLDPATNWDKVRFDKNTGILVVGSGAAKSLVAVSIDASNADSIFGAAEDSIRLQLPGHMTALAFQPQAIKDNNSDRMDIAGSNEPSTLLAIAFAEGFCGLHRLRRINGRAVAEKVITLDLANAAPVLALSWSPQGTHLAFGNAETVHIYAIGNLSFQNGLSHLPAITWQPDATVMGGKTLRRNGENHVEEEEMLMEPSLDWSDDGESLSFAAGKTVSVNRSSVVCHADIAPSSQSFDSNRPCITLLRTMRLISSTENGDLVAPAWFAPLNNAEESRSDASCHALLQVSIPVPVSRATTTHR